MPISQFGDGLQKVLMFLPGTHATSLLRAHVMRGSFEEMRRIGFPDEVVELMKDTVDCNIYFFGDKIEDFVKMTVLCASVILLVAVYIVLNITLKKKSRGK